ncbi:unnamed protein product [Auanema sp. JU1783]|nr:unnamed protein product [Auanema sp. JU1783]
MAHIIAAPNEYMVPFPSHVSISKIQFCKVAGSRLMVASGWDGTVRIFNIGGIGQADERRFYYHGKPVLCCTFADNTRVVSGGLDQIVKVVDLESGKEQNIGIHSQGIRCMEYDSLGGLIVSGSWDGTVKLWDARDSIPCVRHTQTLSEKVYAMDVLGNKVIVGTKDRKVYLFDTRKMDTPEQVRESPLKYQTRALAFFPSGDAFVVSSIEGRVAVEYIDQAPEVQKKKYAFKCHRVKEEDGTEFIYPVNAIAFHPVHGTFATGGSDSMVNIWDPFNRKRLVQLHKFNTSITSLSFNSDGSQLAIASSYAYEHEATPSPLPDNLITIRQISDCESRPKTM